MTLVDTSVWVDFFRGTPSAEALWLRNALSENVRLCLCGPILTEVLQGGRSGREHRRVRRLLDALLFLGISRETYLAAADLYRRARAGGDTIRATIDCIIGACAIAHGVPLLQKDRDFEVIARIAPLTLIRP